MGRRRNLRNMRRLSRDLKKITSQAFLTWAFDSYEGKVALTSSFGGQSATLIHLATSVFPQVPVYFIDTGFHFPETYEFVDHLTQRFKLNLKVFRPSGEELAEARRRLAKGSPGQCCELSKVRCMERALEGLECWIAGVRRRQAITRYSARIIEEYENDIVKVHPIAYWSHKDVEAYMAEFDLPHHPLWEQGYTSIGCAPCTRKPILGQGRRSGRWAGVSKTECGLHTFMKKTGIA
jgi:phosphoadenosine phosphosulfate reductase